MRIAFLTSRVPYPLTGGDRLRAYHLLRHLSRRHEVTLYAVGGEDAGQVPGLDVRQHIFRLRKRDYAWNGVKGVFRSLPLQVSLYRCDALARQLERDVASGQVDVIFVHLLRMAEYARPFSISACMLDATDSFCLQYHRMPNLWRTPFWWAARFDPQKQH